MQLRKASDKVTNYCCKFGQSESTTGTAVQQLS